MTREVLMIVGLAAIPVFANAQVPAAPPVPLPLQQPAPLPVPTPTPPLAPEPVAVPTPPLPADFAFALGSLNLDLDLADLNADLADLTAGIVSDFTRIAPMVVEATQVMQPARERPEAEAQLRSQLAQTRAFEAQLRSGDAYNAGLGALQQRQYERAIQAFDRVVDAKNARADAALYWKAFSEFRLARTDAALQTIARLQQEHPQSRYVNDARVLEAEVRKQSGQRIDPAQLDDDEIKLLAIQGLQRTEQAVPLLEGVLNGANSLNVKKRAIYVLALSNDPRARDILLRYAKGGGNPDLQVESVRLLVSRRDQQTTGALLRELYETTTDTTIRRTIIDAYRARSRGNTPETSPLAATATQDLAALYQRETNPDLRRHIAGTMVVNGAVDAVVTIIRNERDAQTRAAVIGMLGARDNMRATETLLGLYASLPDLAAREAVINALAGHENADALISLAKTETDVQLKTRIVRHLSGMAPRSKAAADYLMDVIR